MGRVEAPVPEDIPLPAPVMRTVHETKIEHKATIVNRIDKKRMAALERKV